MNTATPDEQPDTETPDAAPAPVPPPWGDDFDAEKAWNLIQNLKGDKDKLQGRLRDAEPLLAEAEQLRKANLTEAQAAQEELAAAREQTDAAATIAARYRDRAVAAEAKARAAELNFADATVGVKLLGDLAEYISGDDIDTEKLSGALTALLESHPYLARSEDGPKRMRPNPAQGTSGAEPLPLDAQIKAAQDSGDLMASIALKQQKLYQNTK